MKIKAKFMEGKKFNGHSKAELERIRAQLKVRECIQSNLGQVPKQRVKLDEQESKN